MINETIFNQVIADAKRKTTDAAWLRAIDKAAAGLLSDSICVTLFADDTALVTTTNGSYRVNGTCPCAARTAHCYHRAAKRIWTLYEEAACKAALPAELRRDIAESSREILVAEILNIWPRFAPGVPLYTELLARFGRSSLHMLPTETIRQIRLAIAV